MRYTVRRRRHARSRAAHAHAGAHKEIRNEVLASLHEWRRHHALPRPARSHNIVCATATMHPARNVRAQGLQPLANVESRTACPTERARVCDSGATARAPATRTYQGQRRSPCTQAVAPSRHRLPRGQGSAAAAPPAPAAARLWASLQHARSPSCCSACGRGAAPSAERTPARVRARPHVSGETADPQAAPANRRATRTSVNPLSRHGAQGRCPSHLRFLTWHSPHASGTGISWGCTWTQALPR